MTPALAIDVGTVFAADAFDTLASLADGTVDMVLCDLPYGTTQNAWDTPIDLERWWPEIRRVTKPTAAVVLFAQCPFDKVLGVSNLRELRCEWVWRKSLATGHLNAKRAPLKAHEVVLVFARKAPAYQPQMAPRTGKRVASVVRVDKSKQNDRNYGAQTVTTSWEDNGLRYPTTVLEFPHDREVGEGEIKQHPTRKPVDLCRYLIRTYSKPGDLILDPTCGSGTTAVAAIEEQRRFVVGDSDPKWAAHAVNRIREASRQIPMRGVA